jgi:hypothetical protein
MIFYDYYDTSNMNKLCSFLSFLPLAGDGGGDIQRLPWHVR